MGQSFIQQAVAEKTDAVLRFKTRATWFLFGFCTAGVLSILTGCETVVIPVEPVTPPGPVAPVEPVQPVTPVDPSQVVAYATASQVAPGMSLGAIVALVGLPPALHTPQDDGTTVARWAALGKTGAPRWLEVQFGRDGLSLPHALIPRSAP